MPDPQDLDATTVARLIAAQCPQWADEPLRPVAKPGVDNSTFRLGDDKMVRLPRFERWIGQVTREQRWLPCLAPHLPLPVPRPLAQGEPAEGFPYPWSVYEWLPGEPADAAELTDLRQVAVDLAEFLLALRAVDATDGPPPESSNGFRGCDLADERDSPVVRSYLASRIDRLDGILDTGPVRELWDEALATPVWSRSPVWVHGDPAPSNLLARDGRLSAVIDFGTLAVGDPAVDLIAAWTLLDADSRKVFRDRLDVDDDTWTRGRCWGLSATLPDPATMTEKSVADLNAVLADR
ncbi:aminoglycoside phosphotransferase family protein [Actinophytocola oryzae]|uniref:aminoglycoside phosphotransferase family protein n=1 Tax=Actinophytocola oryzae TaxID=502181 RepID=UPI001FBB80ED|nr:aminoglycoside phosphotransferase family protein [Actinophytocola oryzae]